MTSHAQDLQRHDHDPWSSKKDSGSEDTSYADTSYADTSYADTSCADASTQLHSLSQQNEGAHSTVSTHTEEQPRSDDSSKETRIESESGSPQNTDSVDLKEKYHAAAHKEDAHAQSAEVPQHSCAWDGVEAKTSLIQGAGMGLFATRAFQRGEVVCVYGTQDGSVLCTRDAIRLQVCHIHV
jgi:hypothetical protein